MKIDVNATSEVEILAAYPEIGILETGDAGRLFYAYLNGYDEPPTRGPLAVLVDAIEARRA